MDRNLKETIKQWTKERNIAVREMDVEKFKAFYQKWRDRGMYDHPLPDDRVIEITMRKMATEIKSIPQSVKDESVKWLHDRNMKEGFN